MISRAVPPFLGESSGRGAGKTALGIDQSRMIDLRRCDEMLKHGTMPWNERIGIPSWFPLLNLYLQCSKLMLRCCESVQREYWLLL